MKNAAAIQNLAAAEDLFTLLKTLPSSKDMEVYKTDLTLVREREIVYVCVEETGGCT